MNTQPGIPAVMARTHRPEQDVVFFAMPFGNKPVDGAAGAVCDFDNEVYAVLRNTLRDNGFKPERLDGLYGPTAMIDLIWQSIQRAEYVVVDFTTRSHNVTFEFALALVLGKRIVMISQDLDHVPADYRGHRVLTYSLKYNAMEDLKTHLLEQLAALREEPSQERDLSPFWPDSGYNVTAGATVIQVEPEYAIVRTDDPLRPPAVLSNADVDLTRIITDMTKRFRAGDRVEGAFVGDPRKGTAKYTLVGGQEDPWPALEQKFPPGTAFTSVVRRVVDKVGSFVAVADEINGLIPKSTLTGPVPPVGAEVEVRIGKFDKVNRRISLRLNRIVTDTSGRQRSGPRPGQRGYGTVTKAVPYRDGRGGFILLRIEGRERPAMLLRKDMSEDLRADLENGHVEVDEEIYVEVASVDRDRDRVLLRELPDPEDQAEDQAGDTGQPGDQPAVPTGDETAGDDGAPVAA